MRNKRQLKVGDPRLKDFRLIPHTAGIIMDGIYVKNDNSEVIIRSAFGGQWHFKPLADDEDAL